MFFCLPGTFKHLYMPLLVLQYTLYSRLYCMLDVVLYNRLFTIIDVTVYSKLKRKEKKTRKYSLSRQTF